MTRSNIVHYNLSLKQLKIWPILSNIAFIKLETSSHDVLHNDFCLVAIFNVNSLMVEVNHFVKNSKTCILRLRKQAKLLVRPCIEKV